MVVIMTLRICSIQPATDVMTMVKAGSTEW